MAEAKRILFLSCTESLAQTFCIAAEKLGLEPLRACADGSGSLQVDFDKRDSALSIVHFAQENPIAGIVAIGDVAAPVANRAAGMLGLPSHAPRAADTCRDKELLRTRLEAAGLKVASPDERRPTAGKVQLSVNRESPPQSHNSITCLALMASARVRVIAAITDVPVTPSSLPSMLQQQISDVLRRLIPAIGLRHGPIRVEMMPQAQNFELADVSVAVVPDPRNALLRFHIPLVDDDLSFEELIIRNALDLDTSRAYLETAPK